MCVMQTVCRWISTVLEGHNAQQVDKKTKHGHQKKTFRADLEVEQKKGSVG
jgi:hypothetical protein